MDPQDTVMYRRMPLADLLDAAADAFEDDPNIASAVDMAERIEKTDDADEIANLVDDLLFALNGWSARVDAVVVELRERARAAR